MTPSPALSTQILLHNTIKEQINQAELANDHELKHKDHSFLAASLTDFCCKAITKFIAGAKEHDDGDFLTEVDLSRELTNELIDGWIYHSAAEYKKQNGIS